MYPYSSSELLHLLSTDEVPLTGINKIDMFQTTAIYTSPYSGCNCLGRFISGIQDEQYHQRICLELCTLTNVSYHTILFPPVSIPAPSNAINMCRGPLWFTDIKHHTVVALAKTGSCLVLDGILTPLCIQWYYMMQCLEWKLVCIWLYFDTPTPLFQLNTYSTEPFEIGS